MNTITFKSGTLLTQRISTLINHKFVIKAIVFFKAVVMIDIHYHTLYAFYPYKPLFFLDRDFLIHRYQI
jgi:hypothetical protein